jgi:DNA-binding GntR family transcriptional regulator
MIGSGVPRDGLTDRSYETLRDRILDGRLAPAERLQIDRLSKELGVSHTPVREALNRLVSEKLVTLAPYKGFSVTPLLDVESLRLLLEARRVIELGALERSVVLATSSDLEGIRQVLAKLDGLVAGPELDIVSFNQLDAEFHRMTITPCRNPYLVGSYDDLRVHLQIARYYRGRPAADSQQAQTEHHAIVDALAAGDRDTLIAAASRHIDTVSERLAGEGAEVPA